jgi:hypothetical protein
MCVAVKSSVVRFLVKNSFVYRYTAAQAARMNIPNNWSGLIEQATKREVMLLVNALNNKTEKKKG